jgi:hypothetical protein
MNAALGFRFDFFFAAFLAGLAFFFAVMFTSTQGVNAVRQPVHAPQSKGFSL